MKELKARLSSAIEGSRYSLTEIAEKLDVTPQAVQQWMDGSTLPKVSRLVDVAEVLEVSTSWLQTGLENSILELDDRLHKNVKSFLYYCAKNNVEPYSAVEYFDFDTGAWYSVPPVGE